MIEQLINSISNEAIQKFFHHKISGFRPKRESFDYSEIVEKFEEFYDLKKLGEAHFPDAEELLVFSCRFDGELTARSSKKKQFDIAKKALKEDFKDGAIFVFYDDTGKFRFSFIRKNYGNKEQKFTPWRRYTYFVDPAKNNKTFKRRIGDNSFNSLETIQDAFNVEPLSKEFYQQLSQWYFDSLSQVRFPNDTGEDQHSLHMNAMIRLITRIIFVWFMKEKKLIPDDFFDKCEIDKLINFRDKTGSTYYKAILQNLFFATLNTPREKGRKFVNRQYGVQGFYRYERFIENKERFLKLMEDIPFLNGGLFENLDVINPKEGVFKRIDCFSDRRDNETRLTVPDKLFFGTYTSDLTDYLGEGYDNVNITGLIELLQQYDFTIDENTPYDQDVALDPELLGLVFENLLASYNPETKSTARKDSGSFYTPREVVDFMVEESLVQQVVGKTKLPKNEIKLLFKNNDDQPFDKPEEKKLIVDTLSELKVLDPACGSGAYPMGALQKLVHVLGKVDVDNTLWYEKQKHIAIADTQKAYDIGEHDERKLRLDIIEEAFEKGLNDPDYARKLYVIENGLYGVDIQPIAIQIAKLRFFISLLVDQKITADRENFGVIALPNLETKFVAANSLIHLPGTTENTQIQIKDLEIEKKEIELRQVRHELFMARTPKTKEKKRTRHKEIQQEIGDILIKNGFPSAMAEAIKDWKAFNPNNKADWFDPEWMFATKKFDVVIGNPPYIQLQKALPGKENIKYADVYKNESYKTFERTGDIYALFYEQGLNLLRQNGILCYITSNKWMRARYGKSLRKFFLDKNALLLLDLGPGIFDAATVDTNILLIQNKKVKKFELKALKLEHKQQISALPQEKLSTLDKLTEESWIILKPNEQSIKSKIERIGTPLKDWKVNINYGIKTGYNEAFIIDSLTKKALIDQDPKSEEIIKPIFRGRDIKRYKAEFADLWLINTHNGYKEDGDRIPPVDVKHYPAIKHHLDKYWDKIEARQDQGVTPYNLRNCAYLKEFKKEKIVYNDINQRLTFSYSDKELYFNNTVYFITCNHSSHFLLGILNSNLINWLYRHISAQLGNSAVRMFSIYVELIPVIDYHHVTKKTISDSVKNIIKKKNNNVDTIAEENQIDLMVYKLYQLTYDEVLVVDEQPPFSREAYETFEWPEA